MSTAAAAAAAPHTKAAIQSPHKGPAPGKSPALGSKPAPPISSLSSLPPPAKAGAAAAGGAKDKALPDVDELDVDESSLTLDDSSEDEPTVGSDSESDAAKGPAKGPAKGGAKGSAKGAAAVEEEAAEASEDDEEDEEDEGDASDDSSESEEDDGETAADDKSTAANSVATTTGGKRKGGYKPATVRRRREHRMQLNKTTGNKLDKAPISVAPAKELLDLFMEELDPELCISANNALTLATAVLSLYVQVLVEAREHKVATLSASYAGKPNETAALVRSSMANPERMRLSFIALLDEMQLGAAEEFDASFSAMINEPTYLVAKKRVEAQQADQAERDARVKRIAEIQAMGWCEVKRRDKLGKVVTDKNGDAITTRTQHLSDERRVELADLTKQQKEWTAYRAQHKAWKHARANLKRTAERDQITNEVVPALAQKLAAAKKVVAKGDDPALAQVASGAAKALAKAKEALAAARKAAKGSEPSSAIAASVKAFVGKVVSLEAALLEASTAANAFGVAKRATKKYEKRLVKCIKRVEAIEAILKKDANEFSSADEEEEENDGTDMEE